ncbi:universal stress protein [Natronorubrum sp. DTA7]|uniref:universal stress protein n=1 Tax=Natronorubrum sp. DTA7 TaxID=3447016 RepID=UPI003F84D57A
MKPRLHRGDDDGRRDDDRFGEPRALRADRGEPNHRDDGTGLRDVGAAVHVLYVGERTRDEPTQKGFEETITEALQTGEDILESLVDRATEVGVEAEETVTSGVPRTTIEEYDDDHDIGLIVIGSTGASDVSETLLGTVSKYILNEAPADVVVVRPDILLCDAGE